ncbi:MAG: hypothetical protein WC269_06360 [Candidatus Gracilibacteria bacterium]
MILKKQKEQKMNKGQKIALSVVFAATAGIGFFGFQNNQESSRDNQQSSQKADYDYSNAYYNPEAKTVMILQKNMPDTKINPDGSLTFSKAIVLNYSQNTLCEGDGATVTDNKSIAPTFAAAVCLSFDNVDVKDDPDTALLIASGKKNLQARGAKL